MKGSFQKAPHSIFLCSKLITGFLPQTCQPADKQDHLQNTHGIGRESHCHYGNSRCFLICTEGSARPGSQHTLRSSAPHSPQVPTPSAWGCVLSICGLPTWRETPSPNLKNHQKQGSSLCGRVGDTSICGSGSQHKPPLRWKQDALG